MSRKYKKLLSLVLALIMICSTMSIMSFAAAKADVIKCQGLYCESSDFTYSHSGRSLNRVIECPKHGEHDAEEYYVGYYQICNFCDTLNFVRTSIEYVCLD